MSRVEWVNAHNNIAGAFICIYADRNVNSLTAFISGRYIGPCNVWMCARIHSIGHWTIGSGYWNACTYHSNTITGTTHSLTCMRNENVCIGIQYIYILYKRGQPASCAVHSRAEHAPEIRNSKRAINVQFQISIYRIKQNGRTSGVGLSLSHLESCAPGAGCQVPCDWMTEVRLQTRSQFIPF